MTSRKVKTILRERWNPEKVSVLMEPAGSRMGHRRFEVYTDTLFPIHLGSIYEFSGSLDTKIRSTRLVRRGKLRTFWSASEVEDPQMNYWMKLESQADAIRYLLRQHERAIRKQK